MNKRKQINRRLRQAGSILLAFVLALGISAVPVQAAGLSADVLAAEKKEVSLKQAKKITLKNTKGKNKSEVAAIKKLLQKNLDTDKCDNEYVSFLLDLNSDAYKWTKGGRLKKLYIHGLKGKVSLKAFKKLEYFECNAENGETFNVTGLDVSKNSQLKELYCRILKLTSLDVSKNPKLEKLECYNNKITSLDLSKNKKLKTVYCWGNKLKSLDVRGCSKLERLNCGENQLASLDVSGCPKLEDLGCGENQLTSLEVSRCQKLKELFCMNNQLTNLDVSRCSKLESLFCGNNQLTSLNVSGCPELWTLDCSDNQLTSLDLSNNPYLSDNSNTSCDANVRVTFCETSDTDDGEDEDYGEDE